MADTFVYTTILIGIIVFSVCFRMVPSGCLASSLPFPFNYDTSFSGMENTMTPPTPYHHRRRDRTSQVLLFLNVRCALYHQRIRKQPHQQRLLGMETVFCLIPDKTLPSFHHFIGDLLPAVRREAVEYPCA